MRALCVGMYRACSTWQYGVVGAILERHRGCHRLGFVEGVLFHEKVDSQPDPEGWSVLKTHDAHPRFAELLASREALGLYAYRDLRDVVASYMHKTGLDFATLMARGFVDLCLENDRFWRAQPGMLVQRYDDLIADPARGVAEIAAHLGVELAEGEAVGIADSLSRAANTRKIDALAAGLRARGIELGARDQTRFDPESLLHWNHIRGAEADAGPGLKESHRRAVERAAGPWLVAHAFPVAPAADPAGIEPAAPAVRTSYASGGVDVRLDRLFRGTKGTILDSDALHPRVGNPSYYFYERGWRVVAIGTTAAPRDRFLAERPCDLNLALGCPGPNSPRDPSGILLESAADLLAVAARWVAAPDILMFGPPSDVDCLLPLVAAPGWRPAVVVVDQPWPTVAEPKWPSILAGLGYRAVPGVDGPRIFVHADQAEAIPTLARPLGPTDHFEAAQWSADDRAAFEAVAESAHAARGPVDGPRHRTWMVDQEAPGGPVRAPFGLKMRGMIRATAATVARVLAVSKRDGHPGA